VIVTPRIMIRLVLIIVVAVLLQLSFFSQVELFRTSPDILPAVVVSLGLLGGSLAGAVSGFSVGLLVDCLLVETLGATSMVLLSVGYLAGLYRERFDVTNSLVPPLLCMALTLVAELSFAARMMATEAHRKRAAEILDGGSLYWVFKGQILDQEP